MVIADDKTVLWRAESLRHAGYDANQAALLSEKDYVDLHTACELLEHGCPPDQAVLILS